MADFYQPCHQIRAAALFQPCPADSCRNAVVRSAGTCKLSSRSEHVVSDELSSEEYTLLRRTLVAEAQTDGGVSRCRRVGAFEHGEAEGRFLDFGLLVIGRGRVLGIVA